MKSFKFLFFSLILCLLFFVIFFLFNYQKNQINPISQKNDFLKNLNYALFMAKIKPTATQIKDWKDEVEFYIDNTKIILSTKKNPYWQITSLQQTLKIGKIKNREIKIIDLSVDHPYATFKNN